MKSLWCDTSKMTDGELADLIHELLDELDNRKKKIVERNWLNRQLKIGELELRSWSTEQKRVRNA